MSQPEPDPGNTEDITVLTEPLDHDDDVYHRLGVTHTERGAAMDPPTRPDAHDSRP